MSFDRGQDSHCAGKLKGYCADAASLTADKANGRALHIDKEMKNLISMTFHYGEVDVVITPRGQRLTKKMRTKKSCSLGALLSWDVHPTMNVKATIE